MIRLAVTLGIIGVVSSFALSFTEDFEDFGPGASISGSPDWSSGGVGVGNYFQAMKTDDGTALPYPDVLGEMYGNLGRNSNPETDDYAWLWQTFDTVSDGSLVLEFDTRFRGPYDPGAACQIFLCGPDRTQDTSLDDQAVAISVDYFGLRVYDEDGWRQINSFPLEYNKWYHAKITVDLAQTIKTWQLEMGIYDGNDLQPMLKAAYGANKDDDTFTFADTSVSDINRIEFFNTKAIMSDEDAKGFDVDNINVPEPTTLSLLGAAGFLALRRRK